MHFSCILNSLINELNTILTFPLTFPWQFYWKQYYSPYKIFYFLLCKLITAVWTNIFWYISMYLKSAYVLVSFAGWSSTVRHVLAVPVVVSIWVHTGIQRSFPGHLLFFVRELLQHRKWLFWRWRWGRCRWKWRGEWGDSVIPSSAHSELPRPVDQRLFPHPHLKEV